MEGLLTILMVRLGTGSQVVKDPRRRAVREPRREGTGLTGSAGKRDTELTRLGMPNLN
ncbi:hypothetical protein GCM10009716_02130 [Streptomyces sodiiphilus]|uniref:Uncharacterized protein n=1 Tax=Streptomyces sodiiphilus TaxID=226217 RepID=A0ABN2NUR8_9ACTN